MRRERRWKRSRRRQSPSSWPRPGRCNRQPPPQGSAGRRPPGRWPSPRPPRAARPLPTSSPWRRGACAPHGSRDGWGTRWPRFSSFSTASAPGAARTAPPAGRRSPWPTRSLWTTGPAGSSRRVGAPTAPGGPPRPGLAVGPRARQRRPLPQARPSPRRGNARSRRSGGTGTPVAGGAPGDRGDRSPQHP